jgi:DNA-binding transcriptional LysR family regulator
MDLQRLKTFRTVATLMSFNQAARLLNYAQSSISAQIKTLESEVGTPLLDRTGKKFVLTEAGQKMLKYAHKLLAIEEEALAEIKGKAKVPGLLTLRMPQTIATYHLPALLPEFARRFPGIHLDISSCAFFSLEHELSIGTVDLAFLLADSIDSGNLQFELLKVEPLVLVAGPGHPLGRRKTVTYLDLRDQTLFLPKADCGYRMTFEQGLAAENIKPAALVELNSIEAIKKIVMTGMGLTLIPEIAVGDELLQKRLIRLAWTEELETGVCMIWHKDKWFSKALTGLMDGFRKALHGNASLRAGRTISS